MNLMANEEVTLDAASIAALSDQATIPLDRAALCVDCETVYRTERPACPSCGTTERILIATKLGSTKGAAS